MDKVLMDKVLMDESATNEVFPIEIWVGIVELTPQLYGTVARLSKTHCGVLRRDLERFRQAACVRITTPVETYWKLPNGKIHGLYTRYTRDMVINRVDITCHYVDGKLHGKYCQYRANGRLNITRTYVRGLQQGESVIYDLNGVVLSTVYV